jgi:hypothetical protein
MNILNFLVDNSVLLLGTFAAAKGVYEYSQKRKFEKNLFLHEQMNKFFAIEEVIVVHRLLDWNATKIQYNGIDYYFDDASILAGIQTHDRKNKFNEKEVVVRKVFDRYFDELNHLIILKDCNLIDESNLRKFLRYWIDILKGNKRNKPEIVITSILQYLDFYDYKDVKKFILK